MTAIKPSITVTRISHRPLGTNTYLLTKEGRAGCVVVDPGGWGGRQIEEAVLGLGGEFEYVVLTHEHFDHVGGLPALLDRWPCRVVCSRFSSSPHPATLRAASASRLTTCCFAGTRCYGAGSGRSICLAAISIDFSNLWTCFSAPAVRIPWFIPATAIRSRSSMPKLGCPRHRRVDL